MSAADAHAPRGPVATFAPGTVLALLVVGLVAFVGLGVIATYGPELQGGQGGGSNALSRSAVGYAGIASLLRETGHPVLIGRGPGGRRPTKGLLVLTPPVGAAQADIARLIAGERRPVLLVAPKWIALPDPTHLGWVMQGVLNNLAQATLTLQAAGPGVSLDGQAGTEPLTLSGAGELADLAPFTIGPVRSLRTLTVAGATTLLTDDAGRAVLIRTQSGMLVLSEPDLLDNLAMADPRTAATAATLLEVLGGDNGPVTFDVSLDGLGRPRSLLGLAFAPPFLGATLCLLAAALLMGAHAAVRFGPARAEERALALGKAALLDNAAMLIGLAKREPAMGRRYAALVRRTLVQRVLSRRAGGAPADGASDAALDRLTPRAEPPFAALAGEAERAHDVSALMRAVRALHQRQTEILGERS